MCVFTVSLKIGWLKNDTQRITITEKVSWETNWFGNRKTIFAIVAALTAPRNRHRSPSNQSKWFVWICLFSYRLYFPLCEIIPLISACSIHLTCFSFLVFFLSQMKLHFALVKCQKTIIGKTLFSFFSFFSLSTNKITAFFMWHLKKCILTCQSVRHLKLKILASPILCNCCRCVEILFV